MFSKTKQKFLRIFSTVILLIGTASICAAGGADGPVSDPVSDYLHANRLPLVEALTIVTASGERSELLYGYVATDAGKLDAEEQAQDFIDDPDVPIIDRIVVRPELLSMTPRIPSSSADNNKPAADNTPANDREQPDGQDEAAE
jgi:hypothetical protein